MSNRSNTRWGARQPPRRGGGGGGGGGGASGGGNEHDQNYNDYSYGHHQYPATGYEYETYDPSQSEFDRGTASKRYSSNRNNHEGGNTYYKNVPPRHAKGHAAETANATSNNKNNASAPKRPSERKESESNVPVVSKEREVSGKSLDHRLSYIQPYITSSCSFARFRGAENRSNSNTISEH